MLPTGATTSQHTEQAQEGSVYSALAPGAMFFADLLSTGPPGAWVIPVLGMDLCSSLARAASSSRRCTAGIPTPCRCCTAPRESLQAGRADGAARGHGVPRAGSVGERPLLWRLGFPGFPGLGGSCCPSLGKPRVSVHHKGCSTRERVVLVGDTQRCTWGLGGLAGAQGFPRVEGMLSSPRCRL